ncbi:hypothetical protein C8R45DRAFT_1104900 [Mycena sanguinolenta]|nr:hypothetical protein C8R45DRAFT_1104900 [Mycena sanguinolenta]
MRISPIRRRASVIPLWLADTRVITAADGADGNRFRGHFGHRISFFLGGDITRVTPPPPAVPPPAPQCDTEHQPAYHAARRLASRHHPAPCVALCASAWLSPPALFLPPPCLPSPLLRGSFSHLSSLLVLVCAAAARLHHRGLFAHPPLLVHPLPHCSFAHLPPLLPVFAATARFRTHRRRCSFALLQLVYAAAACLCTHRPSCITATVARLRLLCAPTAICPPIVALLICAPTAPNAPPRLICAPTAASACSRRCSSFEHPPPRCGLFVHALCSRLHTHHRAPRSRTRPHPRTTALLAAQLYRFVLAFAHPPPRSSFVHPPPSAHHHALCSCTCPRPCIAVPLLTATAALRVCVPTAAVHPPLQYRSSYRGPQCTRWSRANPLAFAHDPRLMLALTTTTYRSYLHTAHHPLTQRSCSCACLYNK